MADNRPATSVRKTFHPFSIANILSTEGSTTKSNEDTSKVNNSFLDNSAIPVPIQSSTPKPQVPQISDLYHSNLYATPESARLNNNWIPAAKSINAFHCTPEILRNSNNDVRIQHWVMDNMVQGVQANRVGVTDMNYNTVKPHMHLSPESNRRDILASSFAMAVEATSTPSINQHLVSNTPSELCTSYGMPTPKVNSNQHSEHSRNHSGNTTSSDNSNTVSSFSNSNNNNTETITTEDDTENSGTGSGSGTGSKKARTSFTARQLSELEARYRSQRYISAADRVQLARQLKLQDNQVKTWYQNRRMKEKRQIQDLEHAHKFPATHAANLMNAGAPHFMLGHSAPQVFSTPLGNVMHPAGIHFTPSHIQPSFTQLLQTSPPSANHFIVGSSPPQGPLGTLSMLPAPSVEDIRAVSGQYQMAHPIGAIGVASHYPQHHFHHNNLVRPIPTAFTRVGASLVPSVPLPQHVM